MGTLQLDYWLHVKSAYLKNMLQNLSIKQLNKDQRCWKAPSKEQPDWGGEKVAEVRYNRGWVRMESWFPLTFPKGYQWDLKDLIKKWYLYKKCNMELQSSLQLKACIFGVNISPSWNLLPWISLTSDLRNSRVAICWKTF